MTTGARWPKTDRIRWVEKRLQERSAFESNELPDWVVLEHDLPRRDWQVWLAKERDGLSWQQIVIKYLPEYKEARRKSAGVSKARRIYNGVENALEPSARESLRQHVEGKIKDVFGCEPQQFTSFVKSVHTGKGRK